MAYNTKFHEETRPNIYRGVNGAQDTDFLYLDDIKMAFRSHLLDTFDHV